MTILHEVVVGLTLDHPMAAKPTEQEIEDVSERDFMERSMLATRTIIHVGERPVPCERSFDAKKLAFQPNQQSLMYETTSNEIGKEQPNDFEISLKYKPKPGVFIKQFPAGPPQTGRLNTSTTQNRYVDVHTLPSEYGV